MGRGLVPVESIQPYAEDPSDPACNRVFSCGIMAAVLVSLINKGTANLPGIELCYHANIFFLFLWN